MEYKVVLAPRAIDDLRAIVVHISVDRPGAAVRLANALVERTKTLGVFPTLGRMVPEFGLPELRELVLPPFRIVYGIDADSHTVGVARFWHGSRGHLNQSDLGQG
jgi:plasmid stabilization system protein ParE